MAAVTPLVREVREAASAFGKDPNALHIVCRGSYRVHDTPRARTAGRCGSTIDEIREDIGRYADAGLTQLFLEGNFAPGGGRLDEALDVDGAARAATARGRSR